MTTWARLADAFASRCLGWASERRPQQRLPWLFTNSLKYGALSAEAGTLDVSCKPPDSDLVIVWTERGGPPVSAPQDDGGFGSKLVTRSMLQLGGSINRQWQEEGVVVTIKIGKDRLSR